MAGVVGGVWCLGAVASGTATAAPPVTVAVGTSVPSSPDLVAPDGTHGTHVHGGHGKSSDVAVAVGGDGVQVGGDGVQVGVGGTQVNVQAPTAVTVPTIAVTPTVPVTEPPAGVPTPSSVPAATGASSAASSAPPVAAPNAAASGPTMRSPATSFRPAQAAALAPLPSARVDGALRPTHGSVVSTIGVAAATVGPWLALCALALVMRTAGLSAMRNRLRRTRVIS